MPRYQFIIAKALRGITFLIQFYLFAMDSCLIMSIIFTYMHFLQKQHMDSILSWYLLFLILLDEILHLRNPL